LIVQAALQEARLSIEKALHWLKSGNPNRKIGLKRRLTAHPGLWLIAARIPAIASREAVFAVE
jgi:hypothetical protein